MTLLERDTKVNNLLDVIDELMARIEILEANAITKLNLYQTSQPDVTSYKINAVTEDITLTGYAAVQRAVVDVYDGASASDDLVTINPGTFPTGGVLWIRSTAAGRTVNLIDGTGNLRLAGDMALDSPHDTIELGYVGSNIWQEMSRSNNA